MYLQDERFTENLRQYGEEFLEFLAAAMTYYAQKA
ncbi:MAG: TipAS antibiotic-recognition domain-containing protein [Pseudolactococcus laudensis]